MLGKFVPHGSNKIHLKRCPFCGGEAYLVGIFVPVDDDEINECVVGCSNCDIKFHQPWDYDRIVEKWNTRPLEEDKEG